MIVIVYNKTPAWIEIQAGVDYNELIYYSPSS